MRKNKVFYALFVLAFSLSFLFHLSLTAGCSSAPPDRVALRSLQVTAKTVDTSMAIAGDLYKNGFITDKQKDDILAAYNRYQGFMTIAVLSLDAVKNQADIPRFTETVNKAAKELIDLINSFQKPKPTVYLPYLYIPDPLMA